MAQYSLNYNLMDYLLTHFTIWYTDRDFTALFTRMNDYIFFLNNNKFTWLGYAPNLVLLNRTSGKCITTDFDALYYF